MSTINISPQSLLSAKRLPETGTYNNVLSSTLGIYTSSMFISGAISALKLAYNFFVGNVLDIELQERNIYQAYENAVNKYSYFINAHQAKNVLFEALGFTTASFNELGNITSGMDISTKYPNFTLGYARQIAQAYGAEIGVGGNIPQYSASFDVIGGLQDYDLQGLLEQSAEFSGIVNNQKVQIKDIYFKTHLANWRFFGQWGNYGAVGGLGAYSAYANNSRFHIVPVWENKLQAMSWEDALWTRTAHYSFQIVNNKLRLFPIPLSGSAPDRFWFTFQVAGNAFSGTGPSTSSLNGVNNLNNMPLANIPYDSINSVGKQWIRDYFLAIVAEMLSFSRGKFDSIPIANGQVRLNSAELASWAAKEKEKLEQDLQKKLDELAYNEITRRKKETIQDALEILGPVPSLIYMK